MNKEKINFFFYRQQWCAAWRMTHGVWGNGECAAVRVCVWECICKKKEKKELDFTGVISAPLVNYSCVLIVWQKQPKRRALQSVRAHTHTRTNTNYTYIDSYSALISFKPLKNLSNPNTRAHIKTSSETYTYFKKKKNRKKRRRHKSVVSEVLVDLSQICKTFKNVVFTEFTMPCK